MSGKPIRSVRMADRNRAHLRYRNVPKPTPHCHQTIRRTEALQADPTLGSNDTPRDEAMSLDTTQPHATLGRHGHRVAGLRGHQRAGRPGERCRHAGLAKLPPSVAHAFNRFEDPGSATWLGDSALEPTA